MTSFPQSWYPLCRSAELKPGQVLRRQAFGAPLAIFRTTAGQVGALHAECVHIGADLTRGQVVGARLQCPLHHWEYNTAGQCEHIPGCPAIPERARQTALVCEEHYGVVFGFLGPKPLFPFPHFENEDPNTYTWAYTMDFETPYQVLGANSFDAQHFSTVHNRVLLEPPALSSTSPYHIAVRFSARVEGAELNDRIMRGLGIRTIAIRAHCWGSNLIYTYNARTPAYIFLSILPLSATHTRIFIQNVLAADRLHRWPRPLRHLGLSVAHQLTLAFLRPDVAVMHQLQYRLGVLLPDADHCLLEWNKYWKALPRSAMTPTHKVGDSHDG